MKLPLPPIPELYIELLDKGIIGFVSTAFYIYAEYNISADTNVQRIYTRLNNHYNKCIILTQKLRGD